MEMDNTYDVIVVGYGGAGAAAAITAHDNGANVIILEKMPSGGGNTRLSGGSFTVPTSMEFTSYLDKLCFGTTDREILNVYTENAMKIADWIKSIGGECKLLPNRSLIVSYPQMNTRTAFPQIPGAQHMVKYAIKGEQQGETKGGRHLWNLLTSSVRNRAIDVVINARVKELVRNQKGEVNGVIAEIEGRKISIRAKKAVILTCGGFENNPALQQEYLPIKKAPFVGNPGNTGDGIAMVQQVGAALWHMTALVSGVALKVPEYEAAFFIAFYGPQFIIVDKYGKRYFDEARGVEPHEFWRPFSYFDANRLEYPRMPSYAIFGEEVRRKGPIIMPGTTGWNRDLYQWSEDNSAEIAKGWIIRTKTVRELADHLSLDAVTLEDTLAKYNEYCRNGNDPDFNRPRQDLSPIETPYYAIEVWPAIANTQGGPRRDKESRVLDPYGKPIPGLYAAGEFGSIWGFIYPGGCNNSECLVFGQIAGRNAANGPEVEP